MEYVLATLFCCDVIPFSFNEALKEWKEENRVFLSDVLSQPPGEML